MNNVMRRRNSELWRAAIFLFLTLVCQRSPAATNNITREIKCESGEVWVEDRVHLALGIWNTRPVLQDILAEKRAGGTNLLKTIKHLLGGEDITVVQYNAVINSGFMDLEILSKVKRGQNPAKIHCVSTYGGYQYRLTTDGKQDEPFFLVYAGDGVRLLWAPEWEPPRDPAEAATIHRNDKWIERQFNKITDSDVLLLRCSLKHGRDVQILFEATPWAAPPNALDPEFISRIHRERRMSGNDWYRLFTRLRVAKPGFYVIDMSGATNQSAMPSAEAVQASARPLTTSEMNALEAEFGQKSPKARRSTDYLIDGLFDDWRQYKTAWSGDLVSRSGGMDNQWIFNVTDFYYCNDENYLYFFLKFRPSVEERYATLNSDQELMAHGNVCRMFFKSSSEKNTGAQPPAVASELSGMDKMILVSAGSYVRVASKESHKGCLVSYNILAWDPASQEFTGTSRATSSTDEMPLINHGKDGVELAIPLTTIQPKKSDKPTIVFEDGAPFARFHKVVITVDNGK